MPRPSTATQANLVGVQRDNYPAAEFHHLRCFRLQQNGAGFPGWTDDATGWDAKATAYGTAVDQTPAPGAIAQWNSGYGHVAYAETVGNGYIETTSDSYGGGTDHLRIALSFGHSPDNYIHFKDTAPPQPPPPTNAAPLGFLDVADGTAPGTIYVAGSAFDPDTAATPIHVHVYVCGPAGAPGYDIGATTVARQDVQHAVPPAGPTTGFSATVPAPTGTVAVYAYGINVGIGDNALVGSRIATVTNPDPYGSPRLRSRRRARASDGVRMGVRPQQPRLPHRRARLRLGSAVVAHIQRDATDTGAAFAVANDTRGIAGNSHRARVPLVKPPGEPATLLSTRPRCSGMNFSIVNSRTT
jgi:hypothetical protein